MKLQELRERTAEIRAIAARHGVRDLHVFGSVARGEEREDSDVDFLVEFEAGRGLLSHAALIRELEGFLGCKVDVVSRNGLKQRLRARVLREAIPL